MSIVSKCIQVFSLTGCAASAGGPTVDHNCEQTTADARSPLSVVGHCDRLGVSIEVPPVADSCAASSRYTDYRTVVMCGIDTVNTYDLNTLIVGICI